MHVTDPPWNLAHDRCSTNDEQIDLLPSCSAPSCWSLKDTISLQAGYVLRAAPQGQTGAVDSVGLEAGPRNQRNAKKGTPDTQGLVASSSKPPRETSRNGDYAGLVTLPCQDGLRVLVLSIQCPTQLSRSLSEHLL